MAVNINLRKALTICSVLVASSQLLVLRASSSDVSTSYYLYSTVPESRIEVCLNTYGPETTDAYSFIEFNARPEIAAPNSDVRIKVSFDQDCYTTPVRYSRSLSLLAPDGSVIPLQKDRILSSTTERRYSYYCQTSLCWYHTDVYPLRLSSALPSGTYGVRFETKYLRTVCSSVNGAFVCEENVPTSKSFDLKTLFTLTQTGIPAPWEAGPSKEQPKETPAKDPSGVRPDFSTQKTLPSFLDYSGRLSSKQKQIIRDMVEANPSADKFVCTGVRFATQSPDFNVTIRRWAKAACDYASSLNPTMSTWVQSKVTFSQSFAGRVLVTIKTPSE